MPAKWVSIGVLLALAAFAAEAKAQPYGTVTMNQPTSGAGTITASGGFTVKCGCGWTANSVAIAAVATTGGLSYSSGGQRNPTCNKWNAQTILNLAGSVANPITYNVYALLTLKKGVNMFDYVVSQVATVIVNQAGGAPVAPFGTASWAAGDPTVAKGSVSVTNMGGYTVKGCAKVTACSLQVIPYQGGDLPTAYTVAGPAPACGKWGPITINGLPTGQYLVLGAVTIQVGGLGPPVYAPSAVVNVP